MENLRYKSLKKAEWQKTLFAKTPTRLSLLSLSATWNRQKIELRVHRNEVIEHLIPLIEPFAAYGDMELNWHLSDYDDALNFNLTSEAQLDVIWLDVARYGALLDMPSWLASRVHALRSQTSNPILVIADFSAEECERLESSIFDPIDVFVAQFGPEKDELGDEFYDDSRLNALGSRLSSKAQIAIARRFACCWLPSLVRTPIKAIAVDMDNTLHQGILGEDGVGGIEVDKGCARLQKRLKEWRRRGVFLILVSKNEPKDVRRLLDAHPDYQLRWADFDVHQIGWGAKSAGIIAAAEKLRISTDSILFIDDNPGELAEVEANLPCVGSFCYKTQTNHDVFAMDYLPGLWRWREHSEDRYRTQDLRATGERAYLAQRLSVSEYFESLDIHLTFKANCVDEIERLAELSRKTNQFNFGLKRLEAAALKRFVDSVDHEVVSASLSDRLSDSGIIAFCVTNVVGGKARVKELCISCRALGRQLEDHVIFGALCAVAHQYEISALTFDLVEGPRNHPAFAWLERWVNVPKANELSSIDFPLELLQSYEPPVALQIEVDYGGTKTRAPENSGIGSENATTA